MKQKQVTEQNKRSRLMRLVHRLFRPGERLSQRVVYAGFWAFALRITDRLFGLARTIVLARVLSPNDFGLFGIALLGLSALNTFSQTGFQAALVQKKGDIKPYLNTAWTLQVIRGFVLAGILFGIAPYVASFFEEPMAAPLLRVLGLSAVFQGLTNIGVVYFQKELEFHKRFIYMFSGTLADLGVAIPAALILRNAWALVFGLLAGNFVRMVVSYFVHSYRPRLLLRRHQFSELYSFGKWLWIESIANFVTHNGDDILVGKILGAVPLGLYQMAYKISNIGATEITNAVSSITFPAYSKLRDRHEQIRTGYLRTVLITSAASVPLGGVVLVLAPEFTQLFLGSQWLPMVPAMRLLAVWGIERSIIATVPPVLLSMGEPRRVAYINLIRLAVMAVTIFPLTVKWGITGTAISVLIAAAVADPFGYRWTLRSIECKPISFLKVLSLSIISSIIMAVGVSRIKGVAPLSTSMVGFILLVLSAGGISAITMYALDKRLRTGLWQNLGRILKGG